ncbi:TIGR02569 family protein [Prauserella cavernicola]|uniref:TIGR02569 family protein n=1 Tax=Prauserella cavernicola TaxID=2800127 RepID=A0A934V513_9PSEU|nr:TIGR02569 family protein [Prauserella cavernicola]MBK1788951.1 TIGR02569 family protein [Prauserella cavernicola]
MAPTREPPPAHVCTAFGVSHSDAEPLPGEGNAWLSGDIVLRQVSDRAHAVWLARTFAAIDIPDLRLAKPLRTTDGRWVIAGWSASRHVTGTPEDRPDAVVLTAVKLHSATSGLPRPDFLSRRQDVSAIAERIAWEEQDIELDETKGGRWFEILAPARRPVNLPDQLVHAELFGTILFDGDAPPGLVDFVPHFRPAEWGAAVAAVDAIAWGGADGELLRRWSHLPEWPQLLLRAALFRLAFNALHPRSTASALDGLRAAASEVSEFV